METTKKLQELLQRQIELLKEYDRSKAYESKAYHLVEMDEPPILYYILIRIADKKKVKVGEEKEIRSYMNLRKIKKDDVMDSDLIFNEENKLKYHNWEKENE